jgi:hypothetical protein
LSNLKKLETVVIQPSRAEKRLHRAFRRMPNIRRITPAKTPAQPYVGRPLLEAAK